MVPSRFQVPPRATPAWDATVRIEPPSTSIRLRLVSAKKPIERPSGDQKGRVARSVPASGRAVAESSRRSHN
jgi:hypothetical protein